MDYRVNPVRYINDLRIRHVVMQFLAWMWCIIFSVSIGAMTGFGIRKDYQLENLPSLIAFMTIFL